MSCRRDARSSGGRAKGAGVFIDAREGGACDPEAATTLLYCCVCVCSSQLSEEAPSAHPPRGEDLGTGSHDREPWTCKSRCVPGLWCETLFSATVRDEGGMGRDREREEGCPRKDAAVSSDEMNEIYRALWVFFKYSEF